MRICMILSSALLLFLHSMDVFAQNTPYKQSQAHIQKHLVPFLLGYRIPGADAPVLSSSVLLDAPLISQLPELPRGCEVTSLAMLLQYKGLAVGKMQLAGRIRKDPAPFQQTKGSISFGNPHYGFVGSMTSWAEPGFGVFHGPVYELANQYLPGQIINLTGHPFTVILQHLSQRKPVWVISTSTFDYVPDRDWETWQTKRGPVCITMKEHSVLLTGYDKQYVYFNDPLASVKNRRVPMQAFVKGWDQYGRQALTYK
ncbi:C39 family peptidase [Ectobacillus ponti]|uniref:C39 family peptidase n=1 Tax=Ectobacillus ponti TaxID=2961894 RepID=A0AA42BT88_9BACI|nr:C39 family peptidase [Ectobacillus ponti]MCP8971349.1 C39 family peptidase [Ectobacillus ponti]